MKLPNWAQVLWWLLLLGGAFSIVWIRWDQITRKDPTAFDCILLLVTTALLLVPIFSEIKLFGVELKRKIDEVQKTLSNDIQQLRLEVKNDNRNDNTQNIHVHAATPDIQIPRIKNSLDGTIRHLKSQGEKVRPARDQEPTDAVVKTFRTRFAIEKELRRVLARLDPQAKEEFLPADRMISRLQEAGVLDDSIARGLREVYRTSSATIHGQPLSQAQSDLVQTYGPELLAALASL